jgi:hypothetical protein
MRNLIGFILFLMVIAFWAYGLIAYKYPGALLARFDVKEVVHFSVPALGQTHQAKMIASDDYFELNERVALKVRAVYYSKSINVKKRNDYTVKIQGPDGDVQHFPLQTLRSPGKEGLMSKMLARIHIIGGRFAKVASYDSPLVGRWCLSVEQTRNEFIEDYLFIEVRNKSLPYGPAAFAGGFLPLIILFVCFRRKRDVEGGKRKG